MADSTRSRTRKNIKGKTAKAGPWDFILKPLDISRDQLAALVGADPRSAEGWFSGEQVPTPTALSILLGLGLVVLTGPPEVLERARINLQTAVLASGNFRLGTGTVRLGGASYLIARGLLSEPPSGDQAMLLIQRLRSMAVATVDPTYAARVKIFEDAFFPLTEDVPQPTDKQGD